MAVDQFSLKCTFDAVQLHWLLGEVKGQKKVLNEKKTLLCFISQEPYIILFSFMVYMCKMIISTGIFFIFTKFWFPGLFRGVKGQKIVQNDKKFCLLPSVSQEPYIIWSSFVVCKCKMVISSGFFFISKLR